MGREGESKADPSGEPDDENGSGGNGGHGVNRDETYRKVRDLVRERAMERGAYGETEIRRLIKETVLQWDDPSLGLRRRAFMARRIYDALCGLDILQPLMGDEDVTDIMINGPDRIFYVRKGKTRQLEECFESSLRLEDLIQQIVGSVNRTVNEANPIADARLADGSRIHVVLDPVALNGPILTIRKFRTDPITMEELVQWRTLDRRTADFLEKAVKEGQNIFVCGGTSSGKTTLLNILSGFIEPEDRVITIEDSAELRVSALPNVVSLETREANASGSGAITMRDLIKASLRMNPDKLIIGEVRGAEAFDMLSGMNTGHPGMSTGHANSCRDMLRRLESMVLMAVEMPVEAIRAQIASALDLMVFLEKGRDGLRRVTEIIGIRDIREGEIQTERLMHREGETFLWDQEEKITVPFI